MRRLVAGLPLLALAALPLACAGPSEPPAPPAGGETFDPDFAVFETDVDPLFTQYGCDAAGDCHGGGIRGSFELSPAGAKSAQFDFDQAVLQVTVPDPPSSPLLTEPLALAAGGTPHAVKPFADTNDPDYQTILQWIQAGRQQ